MKKNGTLIAFLAYVIWGFLPLYWHALKELPATEILAYRIVWSLVFIVIVLAVTRRWEWLADVRRRPTAYRRFLATAAILAVNYGVYLWGNNSGHLVEVSLGYFINPLVNVLLGMIFLRERLRRWQAAAVLIALLGVLYLTVDYGHLPWIAFTLALTFGTYGLLRKTANLGALEGQTLELMILFLPSLAYLAFAAFQGKTALGHSNPATSLLIVGSGVVTAVPMLMFTFGARRVTMTTLGILQYVAPTLQFLIGVFAFNEPFNTATLVGFLIIWTALAIYWIEGFVAYRRRNSTQMTQIGVD